jgi:hypothetical protein
MFLLGLTQRKLVAVFSGRGIGRIMGGLTYSYEK